jgi:DNA repair protein RadC
MKLRELTVTYRQHSSGASIDARQITTAAAAAAVLVPILQDQAVEFFVVLHVDVKCRLIGVQEIARGTLSEVAVPIRTIITGCLGSRNSAGIILAHSHPSGDCEPSPDDLLMTARIMAACRLFEIMVWDHLIIGHERYVSLKESGRMAGLERLYSELFAFIQP